MSGHGRVARRAALLGVAITAALAPAAAHAAVIPVDSNSDAADANDGAGTCDDGTGHCTLRAAIQTANANGDGQDTITVPAFTIDRSTGSAAEDAGKDGDLDIAHDSATPSGQPDVIINGAGIGATIIDAHQHDRVLQVLDGASAVITGMTMRGGQPLSPENFGGGVEADGDTTLDGVEITDNHVLGNGCCGGVNEGGKLPAAPAVVIKNSRLTNNSSASGGAVGELEGGSLDVFDSTISGNVANPGTRFIGLGGAGVEEGAGRLTFTRTLIEDNTAGAGGAVMAEGGAVEPAGVHVTDSIVRNNHAVNQSIASTSTQDLNGSGGGLAEDGTDRIAVVRSTISGNTAEGNGGGFFGDGGAGGACCPGSAISFDNSTIDGNTAQGGGGGLFLAGFDNGQGQTTAEVATLNNITLNGADDIGICDGAKPGAHCVGGTATITNSIVSGAGSNCNIAPGKGSISSGGHNIDSGASCGFTAAGDRQNTNPLLAPLADNGSGLARTHARVPGGGGLPTDALLPGSPAIDAAGACPPPTTDQRGVPRPQGRACDIGAFEVTPLPVAVFAPGAAKSCTDLRKFKFKVHHRKGVRIVKVRVFIDGKLRKRVKGHNLKTVTITKLPQRIFKVRIEQFQSRGGELVSKRTYNGCVKGKPKTKRRHSNRHHPHHH